MIASSLTGKIAGAGTVAVRVSTAVGWMPAPPAADAAVARPSMKHQGQQLAETGPPGRELASFGHDQTHHELVLFGGDNGTTVFGDTWTRRHGTWTQQHPARSPSPRTGAAMVYDATTRQLLLFGGSRLIGTGGGFLSDTWIWDGSTWRKLHPATSPPPGTTPT